jgi:hypothetical protein
MLAADNRSALFNKAKFVQRGICFVPFDSEDNSQSHVCTVNQDDFEIEQNNYTMTDK